MTIDARDAAATIQVLFEISNALNNTDTLDDLYASIHLSLNKILNLENFAIALYHKEKDSITFPYFVDEMDEHLGEVFEIRKKQSLTARVINTNQSLLVYEEDILKMVSDQPGQIIGSICKVWAGTPLRIRGRAFGALIVQSYRSRDAFKKSDLDLFNTIAEFMAISIERKQAEEEIRHKEKLTRTLFAISNAVNTTDNLDEMYRSIYTALNQLFNLPNFFIAIYQEKKKSMYFPFYIDEFDYEGKISFTVDNIEEKSSITTEVIAGRKPILFNKKQLEQKNIEGKITGTVPVIWLGVPLIIRGKVIGVMAVQHYHDPEFFTSKDVDFLIAVSDQVALAIDRKHSQKIILQREKQILNLSRQTQELSLVAASILSMKDEKQVLDHISRAIVEHSDYNRLIMSIFTDTAPFREIIGYAGIDKKDIDAVRGKDAPKSFFEKVFQDGEKISRLSCYLPHTKLGTLGTELPIFNSKQQTKPDQTWHPDDMLFIRMNDTNGNFMGVISVDDSKSGKKPTTETVRPLEIFSSLISQIILVRKIQNELKEHRENLRKLVDNRTRELTTEIAERIQIEHRLKKARIEAEAAAQSKGEFLANMSHEIRTPINGIIGMTEIALRNTLPAELETIIQTIQAEADSLMGIINQVLDFSKIEAGKLTLERIPFDLRNTFEQACASLAMGVSDPGIEFISFMAPDVPSALMGDPGRLRQILLNLTSNAVKFTHKGEIFIKCELARDYKAGVELRFTIKDTGIGIPADKQELVFESFCQADGSTSRKYGGTGLGTTISKQLVELMGGRIGLESELDKGSTFWFTLKFARQNTPRQSLPKPMPDLEGLRVLVVDNNKTSQDVLTQYLESFGIHPVLADSAEGMFHLLQIKQNTQNPFNLLIINHNIPGKDGFELARRIRANLKFKDLPVVLLKSSGRIGDGEVCREIGINGYLVKPVKQEELKMVIISVISPDHSNTSPPLVTRHSIVDAAIGEFRVLLVEDYPTNQQVATRHLTSAGYQVTLARNGKEAVDQFLKKQFDLILMDIQMPVMDGYEATQKIREYEFKLRAITLENIGDDSPRKIRIPIVAMTAHALVGYREKCIEADMDDYISKPLRRDSFLAIVKKWVTSTDEQKKETTIKTNMPAPEATDSNAPMDFEKTLEEFENDHAFLAQVIHEFLETIEKQLPKISLAISGRNAQIVKKEAHSIKGGAANLSAMRLSKAAHAIEDIGKSGDMTHGFDLFHTLQNEADALRNFINKLTDH